jgi:DNA-binding MarR family transcriptional regulator
MIRFSKEYQMGRSRQAAMRDLGSAMQAYQRSVQAFDDAVGRRLGFGPADLRCLDWLTSGPMTAGQLSVATGLRPAATTTLIDRLERRGLIQRVRSLDDRRQVLVEMTSHGLTQTWEAYGPMVEEGQQLLRDLTMDELDRMRRYLDAIRHLTDRHRELIDQKA